MKVLARACLLEVLLRGVAALERCVSRPSSDGRIRGKRTTAYERLFVFGLTEHVAIHAALPCNHDQLHA